jgi:pyoverdine/dityrosine biosynthesis protein Dit1
VKGDNMQIEFDEDPKTLILILKSLRRLLVTVGREEFANETTEHIIAEEEGLRLIRKIQNFLVQNGFSEEEVYNDEYKEYKWTVKGLQV